MHAEWPQDFLHDYTLVNHGNHPHYVLTDWATERVGVPNLHNDVAPFLEGQATRRRRDYIGSQGVAGCLLRMLIICLSFCISTNGVEESGRKNAPQGALPLRIVPLLKPVR